MPTLRALPAHRASVLVIEGDDPTRAALADKLQRDGYETALAANGFEALRLLGAGVYDLVVTSPRLPGLGTTQSVPAIRELARELRVIVIAREPSVEQAIACLKQGADEYLIDPSPGEISAVVARTLDRPARGGTPE